MITYMIGQTLDILILKSSDDGLVLLCKLGCTHLIKQSRQGHTSEIIWYLNHISRRLRIDRIESSRCQTKSHLIE